MNALPSAICPRRLPAEWEPVGAVLMAWPRADGDWAPYLKEVRACYMELCAAVMRHAPLLLLSATAEANAQELAHLGKDRLRVCSSPAQDTWSRDYGPITVLQQLGSETETPLLLDFRFNGWGGKYQADGDNQATAAAWRGGAFGGAPLEAVEMVLEGGSIESDGKGTLLTTSTCLLSPERNPQLSQAEIEAALISHLGVERVIWLGHGQLSGDDTDAHIDTLVRFCSPGTLAYVACDDPSDPQAASLKLLEAELQALRTADGEPYRLIPLPWPRARFAPDDGRRLPATYANFLILNGAVLVPSYGYPPRDLAAQTALAKAFPAHTIEAVDCSALLLQHGSLHCATMQIPAAVYQ
ncbi:agmatine/peptidylarginine deiminase [Cyanobium sp. WAJ14-Wanaka]|uniref:agmatine deiminase family protein n=1 Tax=Cyanobium sp. WAJ14-Wanaka TaxID=2823725 RepID=UPI0020CFB13D|nr:agmatine deiminase family protein [Cyanobium sp. WAJ14-Wanaka]